MGFGMPSVGDVVNDVFGKIASALWALFGPLLTAVFAWIDKSSAPTIIYTPDGPLGKVYPLTLWMGGILALIFGFAQVALVSVNGVRSLLAFFKGVAEYLVLNASSLIVLSLVSALSSACASGIIQATFGVDSWKKLDGKSDFGSQALHGVTGMALLAIVIVSAIPFTLGLLFEFAMREGAMEVLAATFPIIAAGLVHEKFARWYWTGLRWMLALIFMLPLIALSMAIGHSIALGAGSAATETISAKVIQALVGGIISVGSLLAPWAMFKMFAFIDPHTVAGQNFRAGMPSFGGKKGGSGEDTEGAQLEASGEGDSGAGAKEAAMMAASGGTSEAGVLVAGNLGSGKGSSSGGSALSAGAMGMMGAAGLALNSFVQASTQASSGGMDRMAASADGVGAGHRSGAARGSGAGGSGGGSDLPAGAEGADNDDQGDLMTGPNNGLGSPEGGGAFEVDGGMDDATPQVSTVPGGDAGGDDASVGVDAMGEGTPGGGAMTPNGPDAVVTPAAADMGDQGVDTNGGGGVATAGASQVMPTRTPGGMDARHDATVNSPTDNM